MTLARRSPTEAGVSSRALLDFLDAAHRNGHELHSFMLERDRAVVAEGWWAPYAPETPHQLHSLLKILLSAAVGVAVGDGLFRVDDRVVDLFPEDAPPEVSVNLREMRVFHLLTGSTGQRREDMWTPDPSMRTSPEYDREFLALPVPEEPGTRFLYNPRASFMLASVIERTSGQSLLDYLTPRLIEPLGIRELRWTRFGTHVAPISARTEDLLKIGRLFLDGGTWNGRRILPETYVAEAIAAQVPTADLADSSQKVTDGSLGYGYQFWRHQHGVYGVNGAMGQYVTIFPDHDVVVAITSETGDMQGVYDLMWEHLLPGLESGATPEHDDELAEYLRDVELPRPTGATHPRDLEQTFAIDENPLGIDQVRVASDPERLALAFRHGGGTTTVVHGWDEWVPGVCDLPRTPVQMYVVDELRPAPIAAIAAWTGDDALRARWQYVETPHNHSVGITLAGDAIEIVAASSMTEEWPGTFQDCDFRLAGRRVPS